MDLLHVFWTGFLQNLETIAEEKKLLSAAPENPIPLAYLARQVCVRQIGPATFQVGQVHFDFKIRVIEFPVEINILEGLLEYVLVNENGKIHESLFKTTVNARDIHTAFLLIGAVPSATNC